MKFCLATVAALTLFGACASEPTDEKIGKLDFWDWLQYRRDEYAAALDGGNRETQLMLAQALKFQVGKRYDSIVDAAANEQNAGRRELAVSALGFSMRPEAVVHLEPHLADPVPAVRGTAAAAIGFLNPPQAPMPKIEALLSDVDPYVRQASLFSLKLLCGPNRKPSEAGIKRVYELARDDADPGIRNEAVWALGSIQDTKTVDSVELLYKKCLIDESPLVRGNAAQMLANFGSVAARPAIPSLIERLKDGEVGVVERAHYALKQITGRVDADRQYGSWVDWMREMVEVLEFVCPRDGEVSQAPGTCSKCGMVLEPRALPTTEFACPEHEDVTSRKPGKCFKCQKELRPRPKDAPPK